jgi:hypothetical protein
MTHRALQHIRQNLIAYIALFFAVGGGGAATAIAATATASSTVHACVSKTSGALYVAKHCTGAQRALSFNQRGPAGPAGATGIAAYAQVSGTGTVLAEKGMTVTETATGMYTVEITASACKKTNDQIPFITPIGLGALPSSTYQPPAGTGGVQPAIDASPYGHGFNIEAGYLQQSNGTLVSTPQGFNVLDICGNYSS